MKIHAIGLDTDKTFCRLVTRALDSGFDVELVNLRAMSPDPWRVVLDASGNSAQVYGTGGEAVTLPTAGRYFVRLINLSTELPEAAAADWRHMLVGLSAFLDGVRGPVVNRSHAHAHNAAKPLHEVWLARQGFLVPPAVTSADPERLRAFARRHGEVILKAICGMRGVAQLVTAATLDDFTADRGPIHLQRRITGYDVRIHVVDGTCIAEKIECDEVDYRAAAADYSRIEIPPELANRLVESSRRMGLAFTGWDFVVDEDNRYWCLEANPMPGYDFYDRRVDGAISDAVLEYLSRTDPVPG